MEDNKSNSGSSGGGWGNIISMIFGAAKGKQEQNNAKKIGSSEFDNKGDNKFSSYKSGWGSW